MTHKTSPLAFMLAAFFAVGCSAGTVIKSDNRAQIAAADTGATGQSPGSGNTAVQSAPVNTLSNTSVLQRFFTVPRPAVIVADDLNDLEETLLFAQRSTDADPDRQNGGKWIEAAQIGLLFGSPEGKAFLTAPAGRALVRGEPAQSCPALNVATARTDALATEGALRACLRKVADLPDCGCRVIARADHLLADRDDFQYAIGVSSLLIDPKNGRRLRMTSEERVIEGRPGTRRLWMLSAAGPVGMLQVQNDGRAAFVFSETGKRYDGTHFEDGFRRGRVARRAYLNSKDGKRLVVLVGFEENELKDNQETLSAWNPFSPLELKKAEATEN